MKVRSTKKNKVNVVTLGCSKNLYDSEVLVGQLRANHIEATHEQKDDSFNIVVINTCGFIESAKQESIDTILNFAELKSAGDIDKLYVAGCLSERYRSELQKEIPEVDAFFGTRELSNLLKALRADYKQELLGERLLSTPSHYAYLKISEGCDRPCSFCAIPLMRGKHLSVPIEQLVKQTENLAKQGTKELLLIAQDTTYYGLDLYQKRRLADLLNALSDIQGIEWIRIHYAFPHGFPEDILDIIAENPKICNYLDIPLQHISNPILQSMRRGTTKEKTYALIEKIRKHVPDIAIRTTLISGYPGETDAQFEELCRFVSDIRFDRLGVFAYSHEEDTAAYQLNDDVPQEVKQERVARIMLLQQLISVEQNQTKIGKTFKVIVDRKEQDHYICRTEYDSPEVDQEIWLESADVLKPGEFVSALITDAREYELLAKLSGK
ncbi:MAG: 30S ribosomal protein S12 methylthiotransferase RimO [Flavobacteriales bacterium]|nr:30S ribosomal protein S12 methylthiotransferase RimO [Flavobacteriales bacterium]